MSSLPEAGPSDGFLATLDFAKRELAIRNARIAKLEADMAVAVGALSRLVRASRLGADSFDFSYAEQILTRIQGEYRSGDGE